MKIGTQIVYIPMHICIKNVDHEDNEEGFVFGKEKNGSIPCRYWSKFYPDQLRTKANSEMTPMWRIVKKDTRPQGMVNKAIKEIQNGQ